MCVGTYIHAHATHAAETECKTRMSVSGCHGIIHITRWEEGREKIGYKLPMRPHAAEGVGMPMVGRVGPSIWKYAIAQWRKNNSCACVLNLLGAY